jgi:hypothetical protein
MNLSLFVLSHDQEILDSLPKIEHLIPVNLNDLDIPAAYRGQSLSENRFFLSSLAANADSDYIGVISGRYAERYPDAPGLGDLAAVAQSLALNEFYAPWVRSIRNKRELSTWVNSQDGVHPGMAKVINSLISYEHQSLGGNVFGGNQFILSRRDWFDFLEFWKRTFGKSFDKWGLTPPFSFRCWNCGSSKPDGFHTYGPARQAGFLGERITAMYFATKVSLVPSKFSKVSYYHPSFTAIFGKFSAVQLERLWTISKLWKRPFCRVCR